jgi:hypothetical protein
MLTALELHQFTLPQAMQDVGRTVFHIVEVSESTPDISTWYSGIESSFANGLVSRGRSVDSARQLHDQLQARDFQSLVARAEVRRHRPFLAEGRQKEMRRDFVQTLP